MTVEKPIPDCSDQSQQGQTARWTNQNSWYWITCNLLKARENHVHKLRLVLVLRFASDWLKNWCESFKTINKLSVRNRLITFNSHFKTALLEFWLLVWLVFSTRSKTVELRWITLRVNTHYCYYNVLIVLLISKIMINLLLWTWMVLQWIIRLFL